MQVFHFDRRTRVYRGRSLAAVLPVSRKPGRAHAGQRAIPLNAVVNEPPHEAPAHAQWVVSHLDLSDRRFPRAIWRLQDRVKTAAADKASASESASASRSKGSTAAPSATPSAAPSATRAAAAIPADRLSLLATLMHLSRGQVRAAARAEAETLIRAWIKAQGGMSEGRLGRALEALMADKPVEGLTP